MKSIIWYIDVGWNTFKGKTMKKLLVLGILVVLLLSACSGDIEDAKITLLEIDEDTRLVTFETEDGLVFTVKAPGEIDLSLFEAGMVVKVTDIVVLLNGDDPDDPDDPDAPDDDGDSGNYCTDAEAEHPELARMAEESGLEYDYLLGLFCDDNYGLGELKSAIKYAGELDTDIEFVLAYYQLVGNWGDVSQTVKFALDYGYSIEEALALHEQAGSWAVLRNATRLAITYEVTLEEVLTLYAEYDNWGAVQKELKPEKETKPEKDNPGKGKGLDK